MFQPIIRAEIELTSNLFNSCFVPFDRLSTTLACLLVELANFIRPKKLTGWGYVVHNGSFYNFWSHC